MMYQMFAVLALCVASASAFTEQHLQNSFTDFVQKYEKTYEAGEFFARYETFKNNMETIAAINAEENTYTVAINEFADMTSEEFYAQRSGVKHRDNGFIRSKNTLPTLVGAAPTDDSLDWVSRGAVTPVKNQGQCGSCWSFSTTGSVEGAHFIKSGTLISLSEQQLVDCAGAQGNMGCNGGLMDDAFEYIIKNGGICSEDSYPYTGEDGTCKTSCSSVASITGYTDVAQKSEDDLMNKLLLNPVSIAVDASAWQFYNSGVFQKRCASNLDHGVLLVGYGTDSGTDYWKIKNSWGTSWGEKGYIRVIRGQDECGLANSASIPTGATQ